MRDSLVARWRQRLVTRALMPRIALLLPRLGATERAALEAGSVGWDGQLFSGAPDWPALFGFRQKPLSPAEQAFLDGPVEDLCARLDDWLIVQTGDLPQEVWELLRRERFFGLIIPERYGGRGFSAQAHAAVLQKLASRSLTAAVTVMVPNSLGPAELLLHYGTDAQRDYYLPRLARGEEIPCFALTGPEAGSDAAATQSEGIVCRDKWHGEEVLGIRLRWSKRYITLAPVASLIGLAFRLRDPDRWLGGDEDLGITCALIPAGLRGIEIGARHDPMGIPFQNGPTSGEDVFVPLDAIIGGREGAGQGWRMLMECLATGRAISLPSLAVAASKLSARAVSAYAIVREQFDTPIGHFEGVEEPLARIAGLTYAIDAASQLTAAAIDAGERPAVLSAIVKAYCTEIMRGVVNDAMDIRAGAAIMRGPRNIIGPSYASIPIAITVEGANILTRSMIIYGQGAIRCHPFALEEMRAVESDDLARFDRALFGHLGFAVRTAVRAFALAITRGRLDRRAPPGTLHRLTQRLGAASAAFALVSEAAMATLGGQLKRRETITGRFADALAWLYLGSAVLKRFRDAGEPARERPIAQWAAERALAEIEGALAGVLRNLPSRPVAWLLGALVFPFGRSERGPSDALGARVAETLLGDGGARESLTAGIYVPPAGEAGLGCLEVALEAVKPALAIQQKIRQAVRDGELTHEIGEHELAQEALAIGLINEAERDLLARADRARARAIEVDAFDPDEFRALRR
ncbi:MAG: acyl-CoA dehydrogenase [Deltaproteobacteria bacterium]|nr:MAG: acyl-CoA dehydrogenase [Deltaproteobacteria bacterium]